MAGYPLICWDILVTWTKHLERKRAGASYTVKCITTGLVRGMMSSEYDSVGQGRCAERGKDLGNVLASHCVFIGDLQLVSPGYQYLSALCLATTSKALSALLESHTLQLPQGYDHFVRATRTVISW
jgi:hypothetical protein